ncbi:sensor histidine kinase [Actinoplanes regularis]|uniref:sensor histidine kinase n=1 Tax=Actinoplanes regularis TaxID=52697 RepID=UPI0024A42829|nr:sensor histidine kinase [Actinoplanes regularis]GLW34661.1 two-component sensor histidine kinase [Actinoplanes regularis]
MRFIREAAVPVAVVALDVVWAVTSEATPGRPMWPVGWLLVALSGVALAVRRSRPLVALAVTAACAVAYYPGGYPDSPMGLALIVAVIGAARRCRRPVAVVAVAVILAAFLAVGDDRGLEELLALGIILLTAVTAGEVLRNRQERLAAAERRATEAERSREDEAHRRATEERLRIARDLHDVAAHQISLINVQAGAALHRRDPETAFAALEAIRAASKEALREMRTVLGVLRQVDEPAVSLSGVADLVARARTAGLRVRLTGDPPGELPPAVDLAGYRIVQESLTNAVRHARATEVTVSLRRTGTELEVEIVDDGAEPVDASRIRAGNGIRGMMERAAAVGGRLTAAPGTDGGFRVQARLPTSATPEVPR